VLPWEVDGDEVRLRTELTGIATFTEILRVRAPDGTLLVPDADDPAVAGALDVLALSTSVSYLKATLPERVELVGRPAGAAARRCCSHCSPTGSPSWRCATDSAGSTATSRSSRARGAEAPAIDRAPALCDRDARHRRWGKDSALTLAIAARTIRKCARGRSQRTPAHGAHRRLGRGRTRPGRASARPHLLELNARGAINGHVPITAIVTAAAVLAATVLGRGTVLVSNERSADAATRTVDGWTVNHQYSKTAAFQQLLDARSSSPGPRPASCRSCVRSASSPSRVAWPASRASSRT
jgi:UDP-N-acetyl-alpha-D-muramoyl-L-alanyl-L-glutamate epimerase